VVSEYVSEVLYAQKLIHGRFGFRPTVGDITQANQMVGLKLESGAVEALAQRPVSAMDITDYEYPTHEAF
jgi:hypothetical protein